MQSKHHSFKPIFQTFSIGLQFLTNVKNGKSQFNYQLVQ